MCYHDMWNRVACLAKKVNNNTKEAIIELRRTHDLCDTGAVLYQLSCQANY